MGMLRRYGAACFGCDARLAACQSEADELNLQGAEGAEPVLCATRGRVIAEGEHELDNLVPLCQPCNTGMRQEQAYDWCFRTRQACAGPMWG
eukprot:SAG22_NODE_455_length_10287_cov_1276.978406_5_plen_92_part_00